MEAMLTIVQESDTITSLIGLLELYHDAIQVIVETDQHHLVGIFQSFITSSFNKLSLEQF